MSRSQRIAITTGDADGIGTEITAKALEQLKVRAGIEFVLWRSPACPTEHLNQIDRVFKRVTVASWAEAQTKFPLAKNQIIDVNSTQAPAIWVEECARAGCSGEIDALVTAPLSKTAIIDSGLKDMGHTGILARISRTENLFMGFIGEKFNVVLATGHIPVSKIESELTAPILMLAVTAAEKLRSVLDHAIGARPLALLGLNPHAGEGGLIGETELKIHKSVLEWAGQKQLPLVGPLVPDAAFFPGNWDKFSVFVANYHDQGLIPFKMIHGQESGIQVSLGLPFVRTSVDHGTAKDIFGKGIADPRSMISAIEWAARLATASAHLQLEN